MEQRGEAAIEADNLFHPLTYGDIDVDAIEDPVYNISTIFPS